MRKKELNKNFFKSHTIPEKVEEQVTAIKLLLSQGYTIFDLEGNILHKDEIHLRDTKWGYRKYDYVNNYQKKKNAL